MSRLVLPQASRPLMTSEHDRVLSLRRRSILESNPQTLSIPQWIAVMDGMVTEKRSGDILTYELDKAQGDLLALEGEFSEIAAMSCAAFNALPERYRVYNAEEFHPEPFVRSEDTCVSVGRYRSYWWGYSLYCNHCLCVDIAAVEAGAAAIAGLIGAIIGGIPAIVLGAVAAFLALEAGWLTWADQHCNNGGGFINGTWASVGTPWVKAVC